MKTNHHKDGAFTAIELLVIIAIVALIALTLFPALANTKVQSQAFRCQNNLKQLISAWAQFSADNSDTLVSPISWVTNPANGNTSTMEWGTDPKNIDTDPLINGPLGPYIRSATPYKCPADKYQSPLNPGPHVRSVSLNGNVGGSSGQVKEDPGDGRVFFGSSAGGPAAGASTKLSDLNKPGPARVFVILDEQADSIAANNGDANYAFDIYFTPANEQWRDLPGSYHNGAGSFSFADGHTEIHQWQNPKNNPTIYPVLMMTYGASGGPWKTIAGKSTDYEWVRGGMPYR